MEQQDIIFAVLSENLTHIINIILIFILDANTKANQLIFGMGDKTNKIKTINL